MRKIVVGIFIFSSIMWADSVLLLKQGWQLIGSSTPVEDMSQFTSSNVEEVWHYDATHQEWLGYSPDASIQTKMDDHNISRLTSLQNWHGFWVKSKQEWALTLKDSSPSSTPENENDANDIIQLKQGWNLISLPVNTVVSANIFKDMTVWKYNHNQEWELFDQNGSNEDFPQLAHIKNSDGIWVKANADTNISVIEEAAQLHNFATTEAMESYIKEMLALNNRSYWGIEPMEFNNIVSEGDATTGSSSNPTSDTVTSEETYTPSPAAVPASTPSVSDRANEVDDATGTNVQENGVDESDIVKHNGVTIFYTSGNKYQINVTTFSRLAAGNRDALNQIPLEENRYIDSLYLVDNKLVVLSYDYNHEAYPADDTVGDVDVDMHYPYYAAQNVLVDVFDVSDITQIEKISSTKVDGSLVTSRVVGDNLYLVSNFTPQYTIEYPKNYITLSDTCKEYFDHPPYYYYTQPVATPDSSDDVYNETNSGGDTYDYQKYAECYNINQDSTGYFRYDYENPNVSITTLTPNIEGSKVNKQALITPSRLYTASKPNQSPTMTTISHFNISDGAYKQSNSFIGYSSVQYASTNAFYLVSEEYPLYYDFNNYKYRSMIYKFGLDEELNYEGIGSVYGYPLNQFSLSEYQDILRIATTEGFSWMGNTNNSIYTLADNAEKLNVKGVLGGLGKEGETIYAVRFMGDQGYVVTYRQTDPLYTIDLSDPKAPQKVGELHVNGYSSYLHPVGENRLLGIGRDATDDGSTMGLKIELFDISDFAHPTSLDSITYAQATFSELEYNHKALAYRTSDDLFAFPYTQYGDYSSYYQASSYLGIYRIKDNALINYKPIENAAFDWGGSRGLIFDMNATTYVSFFSGDTVITEELNVNE